MNRSNLLVNVSGPLLAVLAVLLAACSAETSAETELRLAAPKKIAEVETKNGQHIEFLRLQTGGTALTVRGRANAAPIDFDELMSEHGGPAGVYRALSGRVAPEELVAAAYSPSRAENADGPSVAPQFSPRPAPELGDGLAKSQAALDWPPSDLSASVWRTTHCPVTWSQYFDGCLVKTGQSEVVTSYRDTKYYGVALQANAGVDAFLRIYRWNGSAWDVILYEKVPAGYGYGGVFLDNGAYYYTEAWSRSGKGGNIHFYEKFRYAMAVPQFLGNKPSNVSYQFSNDLSGITHDANNWYLTRSVWPFLSGVPTNGIIAKVPFDRYLGLEPQITRGMPSTWKNFPEVCTPCDETPCCTLARRYNHYGDLVRRGSYLYVSMDGPAGAAIAVFDTDLNPIGYATLDHNSKAPFVAYNARTGYFYVPSAGNYLERYSISESSVTAGAPVAVWKASQQLSHTYGNFQGGKFSQNGNLWMLTGWDGKNRQYWGIDGFSGYLQVTGDLDPGDADESEGVDIIDLDTETRPGLSGQLHLQMLQNNPGDDDWWFMHYRAPMDRL
jgi:hypothetical protein